MRQEIRFRLVSDCMYLNLTVPMTHFTGPVVPRTINSGSYSIRMIRPESAPASRRVFFLWIISTASGDLTYSNCNDRVDSEKTTGKTKKKRKIE